MTHRRLVGALNAVSTVVEISRARPKRALRLHVCRTIRTFLHPKRTAKHTKQSSYHESDSDAPNDRCGVIGGETCAMWMTIRLHRRRRENAEEPQREEEKGLLVLLCATSAVSRLRRRRVKLPFYAAVFWLLWLGIFV